MSQSCTFPVALGDEVRDRVTGFSGIVIALTEWFNKCQRATVQPQIQDRALYKDAQEMRIPAAETFDVEQLEVLTANKVTRKTRKETGGPMPNVTREPSPERVERMHATMANV